MFTKSRAERSFRRTVKICTRLQTQAQVSHPDLAGLSRLVRSDAELATHLLRRVNSTVRGLSHAVHSVEHAIALLGATGVAKFAEQEITRLSSLPSLIRTDRAEAVPPTRRHKTTTSQTLPLGQRRQGFP